MSASEKETEPTRTDREWRWLGRFFIGVGALILALHLLDAYLDGGSAWSGAARGGIFILVGASWVLPNHRRTAKLVLVVGSVILLLAAFALTLR